MIKLSCLCRMLSALNIKGGLRKESDVQDAFAAMEPTQRSRDLAAAAQTIHIAALQASGQPGPSAVGLAYMILKHEANKSKIAWCAVDSYMGAQLCMGLMYGIT